MKGKRIDEITDHCNKFLLNLCILGLCSFVTINLETVIRAAFKGKEL